MNKTNCPKCGKEYINDTTIGSHKCEVCGWNSKRGLIPLDVESSNKEIEHILGRVKFKRLRDIYETHRFKGDKIVENMYPTLEDIMGRKPTIEEELTPLLKNQDACFLDWILKFYILDDLDFVMKEEIQEIRKIPTCQ